MRAFAVLLVMAYHADQTVAPKGFLGVEVFFVLSGFLITTLLLEEHARTGGIAFRMFYVRRALRLFPALYTMLAVVAVFALVFSGGARLRAGLAELAAAGAYIRNWAGGLGVQEVWVSHTWSLSLEEQFYLVWPPVLYLLFLRKGRLAALPAVLIGFLAVEVAGRVAGVGTAVPEALVVGCLASVLRFRSVPGRAPSRWSRFRPPAALMAAAMLVVATLGPARLSDAVLRPLARGGYFVLLAGVAVIVLDLVAAPASRRAALLARQPLPYVGRISYGLYLWHIPVYEAFNVLRPPLPGPAYVGAKFLASFLVAMASYHLLETPALRLKRRFYPSAAAGDGAPAVVAMPVGEAPPGVATASA